MEFKLFDISETERRKTVFFVGMRAGQHTVMVADLPFDDGSVEPGTEKYGAGETVSPTASEVAPSDNVPV
jgi:hypothetical protein